VGIELVEGVVEGVELLASFGELAGGGEALVVGEVLRGGEDEGLGGGGGLVRQRRYGLTGGRAGGGLGWLGGVGGGEGGGFAAEERGEGGLEGGAVG
jgi:hypothetical protein